MESLYKSIVIKPIELIVFLIAIVFSVGLLATPYYYFALLVGPLILFLFLLSRYPKVGFYIILFLIPFDAYTGLTGYNIVISIPRITGICVLIVLFFYFLLNKRNTFNIESNLWRWLILLFVISVVSALLSEFKETSFDNLKVLLIVYTFFAMTLIFVSEKHFSQTIPAVIIWSVSISCFLAIADFTFDIGLFSHPKETIRKVGAASDPNEFTTMIVFTLPLLAYWFFNSEKISRKLLAAGLFAMNTFTVTITYSRGGAIILAIALGLIFLEHIRRLKAKHFGLLTVFLGIVILVTPIFVPASYWGRLKPLTNPSIIKEDRSIGGRVSFALAGLGVLKEAPVLGFGPGTFRDYYATTKDSIRFEDREATSPYESRRRVAHNTYIEFLAGQGLLGLSVFVVIIFIALRKFAAAKKQFLLKGEKEMASLVGAFRISFTIMLLSFLLLSFYHHKYFWASLALSHVAYRLSQKNVEEELDINSQNKV